MQYNGGMKPADLEALGSNMRYSSNTPYLLLRAFASTVNTSSIIIFHYYQSIPSQQQAHELSLELGNSLSEPLFPVRTS